MSAVSTLERLSLRLFLAVWIGLSALLLARSSDFFFVSSYHEEGDIASNALQVERAKEGRELYGNYSRFGFHHPGPAFFYVYAGAELLLRDGLGLQASQHGIHSATGAVLQAFFFAVALGIAASWIRHRLFIPLCLLFGAIHFSLVGNVFISIWPPHVLLMPFLAFWVACVSVAAGRGRHLGWVALGGSLLVHGHVAQPMFVVALTTASYLCLAWHLRRQSTPSWPWKAYPWSHVLAGTVIALFVTPLVIDMTRGDASNFAEILRHLRDHSEDRKKPLKAFLYFLSFFSYERNQDQLFARLSSESLAFFYQKKAICFIWMGVFAAVAVGFWRGWMRPAVASGAHFFKHSVGFWLFTVALCVIWGVMQSGPMLDFNGYFFFGICYLLAVFFAALIAVRVPDRAARWIAPVILVVAALTAWNVFKRDRGSDEEANIAFLENTQALLAADTRTTQPKLLLFPHGEWPRAVSAGLALKRAGAPFYVEPSWTFMFQKEYEVPLNLLSDPLHPPAVWRFIARPSFTGGMPFSKNARVTFDVATLSPAQGKIDFGVGQEWDLYQLGGFSTPDGAGVWTQSPDAFLQFKPLPTTTDVELQIIAEPYLPKGYISKQPCELSFNGDLLFSAPFTEPGVLRVRITAEQWNRHPVALIRLHLPNAKSPSQLGLSGDTRMFGLTVRRLTTRLAEPM